MPNTTSNAGGMLNHQLKQSLLGGANKETSQQTFKANEDNEDNHIDDENNQGNDNDVLDSEIFDLLQSKRGNDQQREINSMLADQKSAAANANANQSTNTAKFNSKMGFSKDKERQIRAKSQVMSA